MIIQTTCIFCKSWLSKMIRVTLISNVVSLLKLHLGCFAHCYRLTFRSMWRSEHICQPSGHHAELFYSCRSVGVCNADFPSICGYSRWISNLTVADYQELALPIRSSSEFLFAKFLRLKNPEMNQTGAAFRIGCGRKMHWNVAHPQCITEKHENVVHFNIAKLNQ